MTNTPHDDLTLALTGDSLIAQPPPAGTRPACSDLLARLRSADARFTNLEVPINDGTGYPTCRDTGTWCSGDSQSLAALTSMGFDLFACATNHSLDWAEAGLLRTCQALRDADVAFAGIGSTLSQARAPAYRDTRAGRVALISMTTTFPEAWRAGDPRGSVPGRPGLNALGHTTSYTLPHELWDALVRINDSLALDAHHQRRLRIGFALPDPEGTLRILGHRFERGTAARATSEVLCGDSQANLRSVREAADTARFVVVSIHSHEMGPDGEEDPAGFLPPFARRCIDDGADLVVCHGPHLLRGLEVYRDRLICYSLGNFFFQNELMRNQPLEYYQKYGLDGDASHDDLFDKRNAGGGFARDRRYWESVVVRCRLTDRGLNWAELHPITLGFQQPRAERGVPSLATPTAGRSILHRLGQLTGRLGATIHIDESGVGHLRW